MGIFQLIENIEQSSLLPPIIGININNACVWGADW